MGRINYYNFSQNIYLTFSCLMWKIHGYAKASIKFQMSHFQGTVISWHTKTDFKTCYNMHKIVLLFNINLRFIYFLFTPHLHHKLTWSYYWTKTYSKIKEWFFHWCFNFKCLTPNEIMPSQHEVLCRVLYLSFISLYNFNNCK